MDMGGQQGWVPGLSDAVLGIWIVAAYVAGR